MSFDPKGPFDPEGPFDAEAVREFERAGWNRAAAAYEASFAPASRQFIEPLLDAASVGPEDAVLDLCCGPGFVADAAASRRARASGLDFSPAMLAEAQARFPALTFTHGDAEAPPFAAASFDAVVSNFGIHHVPRPGLALAGAHRLLRPGGRIAFSVWAGQDDNIAWKLIFAAIERYGDNSASAVPPPGGGFATADDCTSALEAAGFARRSARLLRGVWRLGGAAALVAAFRAGTARMAAMLEAQTPAALTKIEAALETSVEPYRDGAGIAVPIACIISAGIRP